MKHKELLKANILLTHHGDGCIYIYFIDFSIPTLQTGTYESYVVTHAPWTWYIGTISKERLVDLFVEWPIRLKVLISRVGTKTIFKVLLRVI